MLIQHWSTAGGLQQVLEVMEGHFIRGYSDSQESQSDIELLPGAVEEASILTGKYDSIGRLEGVARLIEGLETPYGMELLATGLLIEAGQRAICSHPTRRWPSSRSTP
jgi:hypothetical protein